MLEKQDTRSKMQKTRIIILLLTTCFLHLIACVGKVNPTFPKKELEKGDRLPIKVGLFIDMKSREYGYGKLRIGKIISDLSIKALSEVFSEVKEVESPEAVPPDMPAAIEVRLRGFSIFPRGTVSDSFIVLEGYFIDEEGNTLWEDFIIGEGTSGLFSGGKAAEEAIQEAISRLVESIRDSNEIREYAVRKFVL